MKDVLAPAEGSAPAQTGFHRELADAMSSPAGRLPAQNIFHDAMSVARDVGTGINEGALHLTVNDMENLTLGTVFANRAPGLLQTEIKIGMQIFPHASELLRDISVISNQEDYSPRQVQNAHYDLRRLGSR